MSFFYIDPKTYQQYRDQVIEMSQSIQVNYPENLPPETRRPGFSVDELPKSALGKVLKAGLRARYGAA